MATVNVPFVATFTGAGTAQLETVKQETYTFTGAADLVLNNALTEDIIAGFVLSQEPSGSTVVLNVGMTNQSTFEAALKAALKDASIASEATPLAGSYAINLGTDKLEQYLVKYSRNEIDLDLAGNTIGAAIEASAVKNLEYAQHDSECAAAAASMYSGLSTTLDANTRRLIATQLPAGNFPETFSSALPINSGDKMVFRFNATLSVSVSEDAQDLGASADGATAGAGPGVGSGYGIPNRIVELVLTKA
jgi:hypothetical protein